MRRLFITGTDTEVGKSWTTAALAAAYAARGSVIAAKPLATGVPEGEAGEDAELLAFAAGHAPCVFQTWRTPLSPHRAAALEQRPLDLPGLHAFLNDLHAEMVLIEGVGGLTVPLTQPGPSTLAAPPYDVRDLARAARAPLVIVAADKLGVLNHVRLTVEAAHAAGLAIQGVVLVAAASPDLASNHNLDDLRALLNEPVVPLARLPRTRAALADAGEALIRGLGLNVADGSA